ncbi:MAG: hypothetical protein GTO49_14930 [Anaerolineae bacterium]|nr:hypothetical protein [Anaerolineae bacterium]
MPKETYSEAADGRLRFLEFAALCVAVALSLSIIMLTGIMVAKAIFCGVTCP